MATDRNTIPPIDPQGVNWLQPSPTNIAIDDTHALLTAADWAELREYSASNPSGVYPGKIWKRHDGLFDSRCHPSKRRWLLCWYGISQDPGKCTVNYREAIVV